MIWGTWDPKLATSCTCLPRAARAFLSCHVSRAPYTGLSRLSGRLEAFSDLELRIAANPCVAPYNVLEECLGEHDRSWSACRAEVAALRLCNERATARAQAAGTVAPAAAAAAAAAR